MANAVTDFLHNRLRLVQGGVRYPCSGFAIRGHRQPSSGIVFMLRDALNVPETQWVPPDTVTDRLPNRLRLVRGGVVRATVRAIR